MAKQVCPWWRPLPKKRISAIMENSAARGATRRFMENSCWIPLPASSMHARAQPRFAGHLLSPWFGSGARAHFVDHFPAWAILRAVLYAFRVRSVSRSDKCRALRQTGRYCGRLSAGKPRELISRLRLAGTDEAYPVVPG